ncbi:HEAT repeat-containing protein 6-like isoform X2 [Macrobrachium nipponense]|uniref:HEAT repeat-containing protein 6-like isoform X2 n=1 Tax=Macrobrachium nipponense TaxID=159736 RepID=UPI0030C881C3
MAVVGGSRDSLSWDESVGLFLKIKSPVTSKNRGQLVQVLTDVCQSHAASSRFRMMLDQRLQKLIEHCLTFTVTPGERYSYLMCQLLNSLLRRQGAAMLSSETSDKVILWFSKALHASSGEFQSEETICEILRALSNILRDAPDHTDEIYTSLAGTQGSLIRTLEFSSSYYVLAPAMQCLHLLTYVTPEVITETRQHGDEIFPAEVVSSIQRIVIRILKQPLPIPTICPHKLYLNLIASALNIIYNLVVCAPNDVLGNIIVSACRPFVFYGLPGFAHSDLMRYVTEAEVDIPISSGVDSDVSSRNYTNRNRRKRLRRKRAQPSRSTADSNSGPCPLMPNIEGVAVGIKSPPPASALAALSLKPQWARTDSGTNKENASSNTGIVAGEESISGTASCDNSSVEVRTSGSETDFSDLEGGSEKESILMARVRQCSLQAINAVIDKVGKQHKFSYWPPLMCQNPSLMTSVLKDPSPLVRMASLQVINTFLLDSSQVLTFAVDNVGKSSYTTLGHQLGTSLRELHRCLALALLSEKFPGALVRTLKTIELLVENVNYSKLKPGLLTKIVTHVKYFMRYKEAVVQANAFSVMVSILMIKPQVPELQDVLLRYQTPAPVSLTSPLEVVNSSVLEEELPGEEIDDENNLKRAMEVMNLVSEDECDKSEDEAQGKTMVSWLIQRCVDSLLTPDHDAVRGIYIQVQLQSLKVLSAFVSEHLPIIHQSLPLIQHVISVCSDAVKEPQQKPVNFTHESSDIDPSLMSPDPGVVVEHAYTLLGSLLGAVKTGTEKTPNASCISSDQVQQLWLWTLQGPLQALLQMAGATQKASANDGEERFQKKMENNANWRHRENDVPRSQEQVKQIVAMATVLSHLSSSIFESLGEEWISQVIMTVRWLVTNQDPELRLAGVRIMAIIVGFSGVVGNPGGPSLLQETIVTTLDILSEKESNVNRDRLLASWALANMSSVLEVYCENWKQTESGSQDKFLSSQLIARLLEVGIRTCNDKNKIRTHGVRCVGNVTSFLKASQAVHPSIAPLVTKSVEMLVTCCSTGNNMKTRWNACYALGNILSSGRLPITTVSWRGQVLMTLGKLLESFKNYKVRIQACSALCSLRSREEFGTEYVAIWHVLFSGLDNAQNIIDYQEIRHRDELLNQICQGICQLTTHLTLEDAGMLAELLQLHQDMAHPLFKKAHVSLPPERTGFALSAQSRVEELLRSDALTESQEQALSILQNLMASEDVNVRN